LEYETKLKRKAQYFDGFELMFNEKNSNNTHRLRWKQKLTNKDQFYYFHFFGDNEDTMLNEWKGDHRHDEIKKWAYQYVVSKVQENPKYRLKYLVGELEIEVPQFFDTLTYFDRT
jgi:hypothetical protein